MSEPPLPKLASIPPQVATARDYEALARERVSAGTWAYLAGGAGEERTKARNRSAFDALLLRTRILRDMAGAHTRLELFGQGLDHPLLLAPVANQTLAHPDGELATATAAAAMGATMVVSTQANFALEEIAATGVDWWFQLYIQPDRDFTAALVRRAEAAGCKALVVTADAPVSGLRHREQRAGFAMPAGVEAVNLRGMRPLGTQPAAAGAPPLLGSALLAAAPDWEDLRQLRSLTKLPMLLKGVTDADDALLALEAGIDGLIVSNHGGRILDGQPATIEMLPQIAQAVAGRAPILLDGGITSGADAFKALALGADAVLAGRAWLFGLAAAGAAGVAHSLHLLRAELELTMALTGCRTLGEIGPDALR